MRREIASRCYDERPMAYCFFFRWTVRYRSTRGSIRPTQGRAACAHRLGLGVPQKARHLDGVSFTRCPANTRQRPQPSTRRLPQAPCRCHRTCLPASTRTQPLMRRPEGAVTAAAKGTAPPCTSPSMCQPPTRSATYSVITSPVRLTVLGVLAVTGKG